jgi:hypothetical protein
MFYRSMKNKDRNITTAVYPVSLPFITVDGISICHGPCHFPYIQTSQSMQYYQSP